MSNALLNIHKKRSPRLFYEYLTLAVCIKYGGINCQLRNTLSTKYKALSDVYDGVPYGLQKMENQSQLLQVSLIGIG